METSKVQSPSVTVVLEKRTQNFETKLVQSGTKQKKLFQTSEMKFIQGFQSRKKIHAEKIFLLPPEKKYNGPSLTCLV